MFRNFKKDTDMSDATEVRYLNRIQASGYLESLGLKVAPTTLAKWACVGGGPAFQKFGRLVRYTRPVLYEWATERLEPAKHNTSQDAP